MSVSDEGYPRNRSCAPIYVLVFIHNMSPNNSGNQNARTIICNDRVYLRQLPADLDDQQLVRRDHCWHHGRLYKNNSSVLIPELLNKWRTQTLHVKLRMML